MVKLLAIVCLACLAACAPLRPSPRPLPTNGGLVTSQGQPLSDQAFARLARNADYILLGESHTAICDHAAQARLVGLLGASDRPPAVGFEMVPHTRQAVLDAFHAGRVTLDALPEGLAWEDNWGYDFNLYAPIFRAMEAADLPGVALNVPADLPRAVGRKGLTGLSPEQQSHLPPQVIPPQEAQLEELRQVFAGHAPFGRDKTDQAAFERFVQAQSLWDSAMAWRAAEARRSLARPVVVIVGVGHVEHGWGLVHRLRTFDPQARILSVVPWRGRGTPEDGDAAYFCPLTHTSRMGMTLEERGGQVVVTEVQPGSRAERSGMRGGDVLVAADTRQIAALGDLHLAGFEAFRAGRPLTMVMERQGQRVLLDMGPWGQGGED